MKSHPVSCSEKKEMRISKLLNISCEENPNIKCLITDHSGVSAIVVKLMLDFLK